ncbi:MAG: hypothetical protein NUV90_02190 [Candidatus Parcubacteria bacterium]|nr:hypothetical protein [Candidatus Parcubacteria bacterium]
MEEDFRRTIESMRITILGMPGSGKSTLARAIAEKQGIPYIHIDRFWREGGGGHSSHTTPNHEQTQAYLREKVIEAIQAESWVSDGVYSLVQPEIAEKADTLVYLDIPLWRRLLNHAVRLTNRSERRGQMTFRADIEFLLEMLKRDPRKNKNIQEFLEKYRNKTIILKSRQEIAQYLQSL